MTKAPAKAKFQRIIASGAYKFVPANKTAENFCNVYGTKSLSVTELMLLRVESKQINWECPE